MTHADLIERITRSLAYMLRHQPEEFDLELDAQGYGDLDEVVRALSERLGEDIEVEDVEEAISSGDRPRYEIAGERVRALYGHSIDVDPGDPAQPPELLYVGINGRDARRAVQYGLRGGRRRFLHLARTIEDARETGRRTGIEYSILKVHALDAWEDGVNFYDRQALFLAEHVPTEFLEIAETRDDGIEREPRGRERGGDGRRGRDGGRRGGHGRGGRDERDHAPRGQRDFDPDEHEPARELEPEGEERGFEPERDHRHEGSERSDSTADHGDRTQGDRDRGDRDRGDQDRGDRNRDARGSDRGGDRGSRGSGDRARGDRDRGGRGRGRGRGPRDDRERGDRDRADRDRGDRDRGGPDRGGPDRGGPDRGGRGRSDRVERERPAPERRDRESRPAEPRTVEVRPADATSFGLGVFEAKPAPRREHREPPAPERKPRPRPEPAAREPEAVDDSPSFGAGL